MTPKPRKPLKVMKDTRAGGGAFSCKWLRMNELGKAVSGLYAEPGFFAGEIKSPPSPNVFGWCPLSAILVI